MINRNYVSSPVTCFCIYAPCMLINQHTTQVPADMQIYQEEPIFMQDFQNNHINLDANITPLSSIPMIALDSNLAKIDCIQSQIEFYPSLVQSHGSPMEVRP